MPDLSSSAGALRAGGHSIRLFFGAFTGTAVLVGAVSATPTFPTMNIAYTVTSGSASDVKRGYRVVFQTSGGVFKGETHIRAAGTISTTNLPVRDLSNGQISVVSGDIVTVYNVPVLSDKLVNADSLFEPDDETYSDQNSNQDPMACSGGHWIGFVDDGQSYATVATKGDTSYTVDPDSGGSVTHLWTLPTGVTAAPGSATTDANPTLRATQGEYTVLHAVTDSSNSKTKTQYLLIKVYDATHLPYRCIVERMDGDEENGWSGGVRLFENATLSELPDGALGAVFARERMDATWQSLGSVVSGRAHIKALGFLSHDNQELEAAQKVIRFDLVSPMARLKEIVGYSKTMTLTTSPTNWQEIKGLTVKRGILQILCRYTTLTELFDVIFDSSFLDKNYPRLFIQRSTPLDQVRELTDGVDARMVCQRTGRFEIHTHPAFIPLASRGAITTAFTSTQRDIIHASLSRDHFHSIEYYEASGFTGGTSGNLPIFSRYPGTAPGEGSQNVTLERLIVDSQTDMNNRAGNRAALVENIFIDSSGKYRRAFELTLRSFGSYDAFDFNKEYLALNSSDFAASSNLRGEDLSAFRYWLKRVTVSYADGTARVEQTWQAETAAPAAATFVPDNTTITPGDGQPPPWTPPTTLPNDGGVTLGTGRLIVIGTDGDLYYTSTGNAVSPVWTKVTLSLTGAPNDFIADPFCPLYLGTGTDLWLRATTATRIYKIVFDTSALTATPTSQATLASAGYTVRRIEMERGVANFVIVGSTYSNSFKTCVTTDGSTWGSEVAVSSASASFYGCPLVYPSPRVAGKVLTSESVAAGTFAGKVSIDYGASYSTITNPLIGDSDGQGAIGGHVPFHNNSAETLLYTGWQSATESATWHRIYKISGATRTDISPTFSGSKAGTQYPRSIDTAPNNRLKLAAILRNGVDQATASSDVVRVSYCLDGGVSGASWNFIAALDGTEGAGAYRFVRVLGDGSGFIAGGSSARLALCDFSGNSRDISGNLGTLGASILLNVVGW